MMSEAEKQPTKEESLEAFKQKRDKAYKRHRRMFFLLSLIFIVWLKTTYLFIVVAILPSIVAYFIEQASFRRPFRTVFTCNIAGLLPFLVDLVSQGNSPARLMNLMGSLDTWLVIYGASGLGCLLIITAPLVTTFFIDIARASFVDDVQKRQDKLEEEWGPEVRRRDSDSDKR